MMKKRFLAVLICLCMVVSMWPSAAFAQDEDVAGTSSSAADEVETVCTCATLCTEGAVDDACPVCSAEGADLSACQGEAPAEPVCTCATLCTEGAVDAACPVCSAEGADLSACQGEAPAEPVCTCATLCTEGTVDAACPVCSAEGADLSACQGEAPALLSTGPLRAPKAGESTIYVDGLELIGSESNPVYATGINGLEIGGDENNYNVKWNGSTLILRNISHSESQSEFISYEENKPLTVVLNGSNYITSSAGLMRGIEVNGDLTIRGGDGDASLSFGNVAALGNSVKVQGTLTIESGTLSTYGAVSVAGDLIVNDGYFITYDKECNVDNNFIVNGGVVNMLGRNAGCTLNSGDVIFRGGQTNIGGIAAIKADNGVIFYGGVVGIETTFGTSIQTSSVTIAGGNVTISAGGGASPFSQYAVVRIQPAARKEIAVETGPSESEAAAIEGSPFIEETALPNGNYPSYFHSKENEAAVLYVGGVGFYKGVADSATNNADGTVTKEGGPDTVYTIRWDGNDQLSLNNATIAGSHTHGSIAAAIYCNTGEALQIQLRGTNTVISPDVTEGMSYGIDVRGDCEITGDGTLNVTSGQAVDGSIGLYLTGISVITDAKINATAGEAQSSCGIMVQDQLTIDGKANVTATGSEGTLSYGIYSTKYVILNGGKIVAASTSTQDGGDGINAFGIRIYDGELTAVTDGGNAVKTWWGSDVYLFPPEDKLIRVDTGEDEASASQVEGSPFDSTQGVPQGGIEVPVGTPYLHSVTCEETIITTQPVDCPTAEGEPAAFVIMATGTDITFQWQQSTDNGETWTDIAGATSFIYSIGEATADMDGMQYRCVVTGTGGTLNSNVALLTIHEKTVITAQPDDVTVTEGQPASFRVEATGENVTYQWQQSTDSGESWADIEGATDDTYTIAKTTAALNGTQYRCVVNGAAGKAGSKAAVLTVNLKTIITAHPTNITVTEGQTASFRAAATGTNVTYQWQQSTDGGKNWTSIKDATGTAYTTAATTAAMDGTQYRCVVTGAGGRVESKAATLTVNGKYTLTISATAKDGKVVVSWEKTSEYDAAGYELYVTPEGEPESTNPILIQDGETVSYTVETLQDGTPLENERTYRFRLVALYAHDGIVERIQSNDAAAIPNLLYQLTVEGGGVNATASGAYAAKNQISLYAGTKADSVFLGWTSSDDIVFADESSPATTITMPAADATVTANWHTHSWSTVWSSDGTNHWYACSGCNEKRDQAAHTFVWVIDKEATATQAGSKHEECSVCSYAKASVEIPATGTGENSSRSSASGGTQAGSNPPSGSAVIPQTGDDSHVTLWMALLLVSGAGLCTTAVYRRRRRNHENNR